jgi:hypothetical protein
MSEHAGWFDAGDKVPDEYRHPSGVLFRYGPEVPEDSMLYYRTFASLCDGELVVDVTRRCADGTFHTVCCVAMKYGHGVLTVRAFPEDGMTEHLGELTAIDLSDILEVQVW